MFKIDDPKFIKLVTRGIPLEELERELKPGQSSEVGFLGREESLLEVVHSDWQVVEKSGTTHQEIAAALKQLIYGEYSLNPNYRYMEKKDWGGQGCPWGCKVRSGDAGYIYPIPISETQEREIGLAQMVLYMGPSDRETLMEKYDQYQVNLAREIVRYYKGLKTNWTPWYVALTGLLPHLIQEHYFFEGKKSPYRADPAFLISALNLGKVK